MWCGRVDLEVIEHADAVEKKKEISKFFFAFAQRRHLLEGKKRSTVDYLSTPSPPAGVSKATRRKRLRTDD